MDERVKPGMTVFDADGKRLGKVTRCDPEGIEVVRGFWSPFDWVIRWDEVLDVEDGRVRVARGDDELLALAEGGMPESWRRGTPPLVAPPPRPPSGYAPAGAPAPGLGPTPAMDPRG
ncbi:MAG TPA: hypothetical protein VM683_04225 [Anaeromyxobacteraceae bacterium]|nr:hypothetical protein [Anaeromyxobacteraceae bacterium]